MHNFRDKELIYVTGNKHKFENAQKFFVAYGIGIEQQSPPITEVQSHDAVEVAIQKAKDAWNELMRPLFVNDASWAIPALKGFPGPYMKYVNQWFEPIDFVHLMEGKKDRTIILKDVIVYIDETGPVSFVNEHRGTILKQVTHGTYRHPSDTVVSLSMSGKSILEESQEGVYFIEDEDKVWKNFANWISEKGV
ncbi:MAG TPA: non-canonical purine NTP pyrophosphatase [Candidatus Paceibacterota bacterium]|nr:non-canonical purine NTP pyrophosphatase [Candidatus Paceibacterota bacterium]